MILQRTSVALALAAFVLVSAAALKYAEGQDIVAAETARRTMQVIFGLILAAYANIMPKEIGRLRASAHAAARMQRALRVGGWSLTLAGLGYAALWAFAPIEFADVASLVIVAVPTIVTVGYALRAGGCHREPEVDLESRV